MLNSERFRRTKRRVGTALSFVAVLGMLSSCVDPWPSPKASSVPPSDAPSHLVQGDYGEQNPETDSIQAIFDEAIMKAHLSRLATEHRSTTEKGNSVFDFKGIQSRFIGTDSLVLHYSTSIDGTNYQVFLFPKSDQLKRKGGYAVIPDSPHVVLVRQGTERSEAFLTDNQELIDRVMRTIYADIPSVTTREMQALSTESQLAMRVIQRQWQAKGMGTVRIEDYLFAPDSNWEHDKENGVWLRPLIKAPKICLTGC